MVKVLKPIICRKPEDLRKLKHPYGIVFPVQRKKESNLLKKNSWGLKKDHD
jgi:hypothetical protein